MKRRGSSGYPLLSLYYLATPVFAFCDVALGLSFRVSFLDGYPLLKYGYYLACFTWGVLSLRRGQGSRALFGLLESSGNILLLVLSVIVPVFELPRRLMAGESVSNPFGPLFFINFVVAGCVFLYVFHTNPLVKRSPRLTRY